ncbi:MAG: hypothetical protein LKE61_10745 [Erysipelotrichaceae bacterium]|jgi:hypothetical protein|nr:hypothetical protein [Erysipelotrichaceae bacterium]
MKYTFQIGSFRFAIEMPNELKIPVNFTLFNAIFKDLVDEAVNTKIS